MTSISPGPNPRQVTESGDFEASEKRGCPHPSYDEPEAHDFWDETVEPLMHRRDALFLALGPIRCSDDDANSDTNSAGRTESGPLTKSDGDGPDCALLDDLSTTDFSVDTPLGWSTGVPVYLRAILTNTSNRDINDCPGMLARTTEPAIPPDGDGAWLFTLFAGMSSPLDVATLTDP